MKIADLESRIERDLARLRSPAYKSLEAIQHNLVPSGYRIRIALVDKKGRKKRRDASADAWSPKEGEIRISYEPDTNPPVAEASAVASAVEGAAGPVVPSDSLSELVRALAEAESTPGYGFVSLKWFRDAALPATDLDWVKSESLRQNVLREAIERRLVLTSKVQNPKAPQFPTTAIRVNRILSEVKTMLGEKHSSVEGFEPVSIRGESLSETVLRERR